jgi:hypothetical protein
MSETPRFGMPLLEAAQAQKHVTVNEALMRADVLAAGRVENLHRTEPPAAPADGQAHIVGAGATGAWAGRDGELALFLNGGWEFVVPWEGCTVWVRAERARATRVGDAWVRENSGISPGGAATLARIVEIDHALSGAVSTTAPVIPDKAVVLGVTGRVLSAIAGAGGWSLGVPGSPDRYGSGYGTGAGSFAHGVTGQPLAYYGATALRITAEGGAFAGGTLRLAVHILELRPPEAV